MCFTDQYGDVSKKQLTSWISSTWCVSKLWWYSGCFFSGMVYTPGDFNTDGQVMCSLQNGAIAPNLHFNSLNPHIDLANSRLVVPTAATWLRRHWLGDRFGWLHFWNHPISCSNSAISKIIARWNAHWFWQFHAIFDIPGLFEICVHCWLLVWNMIFTFP